MRQTAPKDPIVFYGSSTIRLWGTLASDLADQRAVNLGFGGSTLEACDHFFERLVPPLAPCSLVIYAGDNDLGDGQTPEAVLASFRRLAAKIERDLPAVGYGFISIKPSPARLAILDRIQAANTLIRGDVAGRPNAYFMDVFSAMLASDGRPDAGFFESDGLHLNGAGYQLWTKLLSPFRHQIFTTDCSSIQNRPVRLAESESNVSPLVQPEPRP